LKLLGYFKNRRR